MKDTVLAYLVQQQAEEGLTGAAMAKRLGMGETQWSHIRRGRANLTVQHIERAIDLYPDLLTLLGPAASPCQRVLT